MKILIQRVLNAQVQINTKVHSSIQSGLLLFICFEQQDTDLSLTKAIDKIISLRLFEDHNKKMNLNTNQVDKEILAVSQFTLSWSGEKGNRPSFEKSMSPDKAKEMYLSFLSLLRSKLNRELKSGIFGADMKIQSTNDGPVTFLLSF